jgi:RNA-splicing ligase RtcB
MPDVHAGAGCTIGTTMTISDKVVPNLVGVDIGCGMETVKLKDKRIDLPKLDSFIHGNIPCGMSVRDNVHKYINETHLDKMTYIFLDEIQAVPDFQKAVDSLFLRVTPKFCVNIK